MNKYILGLFSLFLFLGAFQVNASWINDEILKQTIDLRSKLGASVSGSLDYFTKSSDLAPRISVWQGKVNQHFDVSLGAWVTDSDGRSGAELDKLFYCKKWYPNTVKIEEYKKELINTWRAGGNTGLYPGTNMSYKCVESAPFAPPGDPGTGTSSSGSFPPPGDPGSSTAVTLPPPSDPGTTNNTIPSIKILSPNGGEVFKAGENITVKWNSTNIVAKIVNIFIEEQDPVAPDLKLLASNVSNNKDGYNSAVITLPKEIKYSYGKNFKIFISNDASGGDYSDNTFSINKNSDTISTTPTEIQNPRISMWKGKVNQHVTKVGNIYAWVTDEDGKSGANLDKLAYCKKWYPNTKKVESFKNETINTWRTAGNKGLYSGTNMSYECIQEGIKAEPSIKILSPNGGESYKIGDKITVKWNTLNIPLNDRVIIALDGVGPNYDRYLLSGPNGVLNNDSGGVTYTIDSKIRKGNYVTRIRNISKDGNIAITEDKSDSSFSIAPNDLDISPSIKILSPNGGEVFKAGENITVKWNSTNIVAKIVNIFIEEQDPVAPDLKLLASNVSNNKDGYNSAVITLPKEIKYSYGKNFKIFISNDASGGDYSDNTFTITNNLVERPYDPNISTGKRVQDSDSVSSNVSTLPTIYNKSVSLKMGDVSEEVKTLQKYLGITADGKFGKGTLSKVKEWQIKNNLNPDGVFGLMSKKTANILQ